MAVPQTRQQLMDQISELLGIPHFEPGVGSSVYNPFIDAAALALGLDPTAFQNKYRRIEAMLATVGQPYDPRLDSSEHRGPSGGGTITNHALRKLAEGLVHRARLRYFILNESDNEAAAGYADIRGESYGFNSRVSGHRRLIEAAQQAQVIFYRTSNATLLPMSFVAGAVVDAIESTGPSSWRAILAAYARFPNPVPAEAVDIPGWNRQHGIAEIQGSIFHRIVTIGGEDVLPMVPPDVPEPSVDPLGPVSLHDLSITELKARPAASDARPMEPVLPVQFEASSAPGHEQPPRGRRRRGKLDRWAEKRAVHIALVYLEEAGWQLVADRQTEGVGFDLEFSRHGSALLVEIKGIQSNRLAFNMTALEWATALASPNYLVLAVTDVLSLTGFKVNALGQEELFAMGRAPVQFRLSPAADGS
jgi:hypothetical protein